MLCILSDCYHHNTLYIEPFIRFYVEWYRTETEIHYKSYQVRKLCTAEKIYYINTSHNLHTNVLYLLIFKIKGFTMKYFRKDHEIKERFEFALSDDSHMSDATLNYLRWVFE